MEKTYCTCVCTLTTDEGQAYLTIIPELSDTDDEQYTIPINSQMGDLIKKSFDTSNEEQKIEI